MKHPAQEAKLNKRNQLENSFLVIYPLFQILEKSSFLTNLFMPMEYESRPTDIETSMVSDVKSVGFDIWNNEMILSQNRHISYSV